MVEEKKIKKQIFLGKVGIHINKIKLEVIEMA